MNDVESIEKASFPSPWPRDVFMREFQLPISRCLVAKKIENQNVELAGYVIYWIVAGESQIHKIAVKEEMRNSGIATKLMAEMLRLSREEDAHLCTLEVGRSNDSAKNLYEKFGFVVREVRKRYYRESGEDALIMYVELKS